MSGMRDMVRLMGVGIAGSFLVAVPAVAMAADITITVTISNLAVSVSDGSVAFGTVGLGSHTVAAEKQVVTNTGNVAQTYTIRLTTADLLTTGETETAAGANTFVLQGLFTGAGSAAPGSADFGGDAGTSDDVVRASGAQTSSATIYAWTGSTANGSSVPAAGVRDLYFKYSAPTSDSATGGAQENLAVTVAANAA